MASKEKVNIRQVAEAAGVSVATVSGILNSNGRHAPATAAKVRAVMQELGYVPRRNRLRKKAPRGKNAIKRVALLFPDTTRHGTRTPLGQNLIRGVEDVLSEQSIEVFIMTLKPDGSLPDEIQQGKMDGIILRSGSGPADRREEMLDVLADAGVPVVWTFGFPPGITGDAVMVDNRSCGMWAAARVDVEKTTQVIMLRPPGNPNLDFEYRMVAFTMYLQGRGYPASRILTRSFSGLPKVIQTHGKDDRLVLFVPGHDQHVQEAHTLVGQRGKKRAVIDLVGVMSDDSPMRAHVGENLQILHIDPYNVGRAAGQQLLLRMATPWAEVTRLLVQPKEL